MPAADHSPPPGTRPLRSAGRALALVGALAVAACSSTADGSAPATGEAAAILDGTSTTVAPEPSAPTTAPGREPRPQPVTFVFGGDVHFEGRVAASLDRRAEGPLAGMAGAFAPEDIVVVNLETAITETDGAVAKTFTFKAPPAALDELVDGGVDVVSLANNHGMDFGVRGLQDTLQAAEAAGLPLVGAGTSAAEAFAPWTTTVGDHRVAVLGATQVLDSAFEATWTADDDSPGLASAKQPQRLLDAVRAAAADADTVAVMLHWGVEKQTCPTRAQQQLAEALVEAGADIVVGGHAHRLQGAGRMGPAIVGYGLGNLVFDVPDGGDSARSGMLRVRADGAGHLDHQWVPAQISGGLPRRLEGPSEAAAIESWAALRACTGLSA